MGQALAYSAEKHVVEVVNTQGGGPELRPSRTSKVTWCRFQAHTIAGVPNSHMEVVNSHRGGHKLTQERLYYHEIKVLNSHREGP